jgi:hypothetical protein
MLPAHAQQSTDELSKLLKAFPSFYPKLIIIKYHAMYLSKQDLLECPSQDSRYQITYQNEIERRIKKRLPLAEKAYQDLPEQYRKNFPLKALAQFYFYYPHPDLVGFMRQYTDRGPEEFYEIALAACRMMDDYDPSLALPRFAEQFNQKERITPPGIKYFIVLFSYLGLSMALDFLSPYRAQKDKGSFDHFLLVMTVLLQGASLLYWMLSLTTLIHPHELDEDFFEEFHPELLTTTEKEYHALCKAIIDTKSPLSSAGPLSWHWSPRAHSKHFSVSVMLLPQALLSLFFLSPMFWATSLYTRSSGLDPRFSRTEKHIFTTISLALFLCLGQWTNTDYVAPLLNQAQLPKKYFRACLTSSLWYLLTFSLEEGYLHIRNHAPQLQETLRKLHFSYGNHQQRENVTGQQKALPAARLR